MDETFFRFCIVLPINQLENFYWDYDFTEFLEPTKN